MNISRFGQNFATALVKPGTKVLSSVRPELVALSTKDKFSLNDKARKLLGVELGHRIALFDDMSSVNPSATGINDRFFLIPNYKDASGQIVGSKIGTHFTFSYSGVWSGIMCNDLEVVVAKPEDMVRMGKAKILTRQAKLKSGELATNKDGSPVMVESCIATQKVFFEIKPALNEEGENEHFLVDGEGKPFPVANQIFILTAAEIQPYDVNEGDDDEEELDDVPTTPEAE